MTEKKLPQGVGGQAVIEGVMMRTPNAMAVSVRKKDGSIVVKRGPWQPVWSGIKFLKRPFLRGIVILVESMHNGVSALNFSAQQAELEDDSKNRLDQDKNKTKTKKAEKPISKTALSVTIGVSFIFAFGLFVFLPHALTWLLGTLLHSTGLQSGTALSFHFVDGIIKITIFLLYLYFISKLKDIHRIFEYHGAEHKTVFTYENHELLTPKNAQKYTTHHPRCGTSFLILVILISILVFTLIFPWIPQMVHNKLLNQLILISIKLPLMFPVAGIAYEAIKISSKYPDSVFTKILAAPGLWLQRITTKPPDDSMLEIAIVSVIASLDIEMNGHLNETEINTYADFDDFLDKIKFRPEY